MLLPELKSVEPEHKDVPRIATKYQCAASVVEAEAAGTNEPRTTLVGIKLLDTSGWIIVGSAAAVRARRFLAFPTTASSSI
jgi:hypothetical protein